MKKNGLKKKNIFLIGVLAVAGLFGVSAAAIDKQVNEEPVAEKAEAYNKISEDRIIYFTSPGWTDDHGYQSDFAIKYSKENQNNGSWGWMTMSKVYVNNMGEEVYSGIVPYDTYVFQIKFTHHWSTYGYYRDYYTDYLDAASNTLSTNNKGFYRSGGGDGQILLGTWTVTFFTIRYNANGGTGSMSDQTAYPGAQSGNEVVSCTYTRDGYDFAGWNTQADGKGDKKSVGDNISGSAGDVKNLYAQWEPQDRTVTVVSNDDDKGTVSVSDNGTVPYGSSITLTATPKLNYVFLGWKNGESSTYESTSSSYTVPSVTSNSTYTGYFASPTTYEFFFDKKNWSDKEGSLQLYWVDSTGCYSTTESSCSRVTSIYGSETAYSGDELWYKFTVTTGYTISKMVFFCGSSITSNNVQTTDIGSEYITDGNVYGVNGVSEGKKWSWSLWGSDCDGYIYSVNKYRKVGSSSPEQYGSTLYILCGEYHTPGLASNVAPTGYHVDGSDGWYANSSFTGTLYDNSTSYHVLGITNLYSKFAINTHTITYYRNDEHSTNNTYSPDDPINFHATHTVLSIDESPIGWGASPLRTFLRWDTNSSGTGEDSYLAGETLTMQDKDVELYSIQAWHVFECSIDGGETWVSMDRGSEGGYLVKFTAHEDMDLRAGRTVSFRYRPYGSNGEYTSVTIDSTNYSGNCINGVISLSTVGKPILKATYDSTEDEVTFYCEVPGQTERTIIVIHTNADDTTTTTRYSLAGTSDSADGKKQCVTIGHIYVRKGDLLKAGWYDTVYNVWFEGGTDGFSNPGATYDSSKAVVCNYTGAYTVYLKRTKATYPEEWNNVYVERDNGLSASYYGEMFDQSLSTVCANYNTNTVSDFLDAWYDEEESAVTIFNELPQTVQDGLKSDTYDSYGEVLKFKSKYNYILSKYGYSTSVSASELYDFLGMSPAPLSAFRYSPFSLSGDGEVDASTIIIIIASSVALLSVTALSILVLKKRRREQE